MTKAVRQRVTIFLILTLVLQLFLSQIAFAATPTTYVYEGRLLDSSGVPINTAHTFRFSFWKTADWGATDTTVGGAVNTSATNYGGWFETQNITPSTTGTFSVNLGTSTPLPEINFTNHKYLQVEIKVQGDADTTYQLMDPSGDAGVDTDDRKTIGSLPYASTASTSDSTNVETFIIDKDDTISTAGTGSIQIEFGDALNKVLEYDTDNTYFNFNDDLNITGNITATGDITSTGTLSIGDISSSGNLSAEGLSTTGDLNVDGQITTGTGDTIITQADGKLDGEQIADDTIDDDSLDFGMGTDQIGADDITMTDEFDNSNATNIQDVVDDIDQALTDAATGSSNNTGTTANTYVYDSDDTGGDVTLQFGTTLSEQLYWNNTGSTFTFTDDLNVTGGLDVDGQITTGTGDTIITQADGKLDGEQIADDTIDDDSLDFGMGADQIGADDITMTDEFDNSNATNIQDVVDDIDQALTDAATGSSDNTGTTANTFVFDSDDTGGDVELQFGTTLSEKIYWDNVANLFKFTDDLSVTGDLFVSAAIHAGTGNVQLTNPDGTLDGEVIADNSIDQDSIDWGTSTGQISASDLPVEDTNDYWEDADIESILDELGEEIYDRWGTGLISGGVISDNGGNTINITAGEGYINYNTIKNKKITWTAKNNQTLTLPGDNFIYIDNTGSLLISPLPPLTGASIFLGYVYTVQGNTDIGMISAVPSYISNYEYRINSWVQQAIGALVSSGNIVGENTTDLTLLITAGMVHNNLSTFMMTEKTTFTKWHNSADLGWVPDTYSPNYVNTAQINTTTNNAYANLTGTVTFTNASATVTGASSSFLAEVSVGDYIYFMSDSYMYKAKVQSVDSDTQITLVANYAGAGGAGVAKLDKTLVDMTNGYWKKDIVLRTMDDNVHYIYGQQEYATETAATEAAIPTIPSAISAGGSVLLAAIVTQKGDTNLDNRLYDLRPNFERVFGYGTAGVVGTVADHGSLAGLGDDDHAMYYNTNGSDTMTGDVDVGNNSILNATIDGDENTVQDIDWTSLKTRNKTLYLMPEYDGLLIDEDGSNNIATMWEGHDGSVEQNYYVLSSAQTSLNDLTVNFLIALPDDFVSWQATPLQIFVKSTTISSGDNQIDIAIEDTANNPVTLVGNEDLHSTVANTWVQKNITMAGSPTWLAGETIEIAINMQAKNNNRIALGMMRLNYTGK